MGFGGIPIIKVVKVCGSVYISSYCLVVRESGNVRFRSGPCGTIIVHITATGDNVRLFCIKHGPGDTRKRFWQLAGINSKNYMHN